MPYTMLFEIQVNVSVTQINDLLGRFICVAEQWSTNLQCLQLQGYVPASENVCG